MGTGRIHPDPSAVIWLARQSKTLEYIKTLDEWVKSDYAGSSDVLLPEIRKCYADLKRKGVA